MATKALSSPIMLDGSNATPVIRDLPVHGTGAYAIGDLVRRQRFGGWRSGARDEHDRRGDWRDAGSAGAPGRDAACMKVAIITREQVWRCSMDAATTAFVVGYTKTIDTVDHNTISATDSTGGSDDPGRQVEP